MISKGQDYTERYMPYFGVEFEADTVKKINLRGIGAENSELFLISLIEHKSKADYNVSVQLLKYMVCIWTEYEKQFGTEYKGKVKTKEFRYPPVLPIVYHEGTDRWTAPMCVKDRVFMQEIFADYIPDFTYCLINNQDYSNEELLEHNDEMSLIMLLNKIQNSADWSRFIRIPPGDINQIVEKSPEAVIDIIVLVIQALCTKLNVSQEDTEECVRKVRTRDMGYLWENMEKIDVQGTYELYIQTKAQLKEATEQAQKELETVKAQSEKELETVKAHAKRELEEYKAAKALAEEENARLKALLLANNIQPDRE